VPPEALGREGVTLAVAWLTRLTAASHRIAHARQQRKWWTAGCKSGKSTTIPSSCLKPDFRRSSPCSDEPSSHLCGHGCDKCVLQDEADDARKVLAARLDPIGAPRVAKITPPTVMPRRVPYAAHAPVSALIQLGLTVCNPRILVPERQSCPGLHNPRSTLHQQSKLCQYRSVIAHGEDAA